MAERHRSIRFRITATAAAAVFAVLAATAVALVAAQRATLTGDLEDALADSATTLAVAARGGGLDGAVLRGFGDDDAVAQVLAADGTVVAATANLEGAAPLAPADASPGAGDDLSTRRLPGDDDPYRVLRRPLPGGGAVVVGTELEDVEDSTAALAGSLLVGVPATALVLAALVWWLVGRTLRPVEAIRSSVAAIGADDLARRVPEPGTGDEVDQLARTMNAMLGRLEEASERQRRFVADASHELRTPLTRLRAELEASGASDDVRRSVLDEIVDLQQLVDDLLLVARRGSGPTRRVPVDLDDLVLREAARVRAQGRVAVDTASVSAAQLDGDPGQLARLVTNLLDNAERHATSTVTVSLAERDRSAVLTVADDGPGVPAGEEQRIFERFTRLDGARSRADGGAGLGLAIVREIVEAHGGDVAVEPPAAGPGAVFVVRLPRAVADLGCSPGGPGRRTVESP